MCSLSSRFCRSSAANFFSSYSRCLSSASSFLNSNFSRLCSMSTCLLSISSLDDENDPIIVDRVVSRRLFRAVFLWYFPPEVVFVVSAFFSSFAARGLLLLGPASSVSCSEALPAVVSASTPCAGGSSRASPLFPVSSTSSSAGSLTSSFPASLSPSLLTVFGGSSLSEGWLSESEAASSISERKSQSTIRI